MINKKKGEIKMKYIEIERTNELVDDTLYNKCYYVKVIGINNETNEPVFIGLFDVVRFEGSFSTEFVEDMKTRIYPTSKDSIKIEENGSILTIKEA